jgi:hypothetical protein
MSPEPKRANHQDDTRPLSIANGDGPGAPDSREPEPPPTEGERSSRGDDAPRIGEEGPEERGRP